MKQGFMLRYLTGLCAALAVLCAFATGAQAGSDRDVARYGKDNKGVLTNTFGNCVRTKWDAGSDPCAAPAPEPAPVAAAPAPAPQPRTVIAKEERTVYFGFNETSITPESQQTLASLAAKLKSDTQIKQARVVGYADRVGSDSYNEKLSEKRAQAVRDHLIANGFAKLGATETRWLGETTPATQCGDDLKREELIACLSKDRRVEVEIDYLTEVMAGQ